MKPVKSLLNKRQNIQTKRFEYEPNFTKVIEYSKQFTFHTGPLV